MAAPVQATGGNTFPPAQVPAPHAQHPMASLYVGDLHPDVTESMLYNKFAAIGQVLSIRVCRDAITRRSLGYAYVNYQQLADAERALDSMNFDPMNGKPIRIMWSQRDPTVRRSGNGNIFIKNLDPQIDTKSIHDTFSMFGNILSCKIACDDEGKSKGYGFIHFEQDESAQKAIDKVNGMMLDNKVVYVAKFLPRGARLREMGEAAHQFTNVYVKNFADKLDDDSFHKLFEKFGTILSSKVMRNEEGVSRGFGFVSFETHESAEKAVAEMNDFQLPDTDLKLTVCRAQKKAERVAELTRLFEANKLDHAQRFQGTNLYVKNLDDTIDSDELHRLFEPFGTITSAKVMSDDNGCSKGFGFVCYETSESATKAVAEMNGKMVCNKPLYVASAQRRDDRRTQLARQYMERMANGRMAQNAGMQQRWTPAIGNVGFGGPGYMVPPNQYIGRPPMMPFGAVQPTQYIGQPGMRQQARPQNYQFGNRAGGFGNQTGMRRPQQQPRWQKTGPQQVQRQQSDLASNLASVTSEQEQKQIIGTQLYPLVNKICGDGNVGKITGMLLEMETSDLLLLLENPDVLRDRVKEAVGVLESSKQQGA